VDGEDRKTVVLGADHGGFRLKEALKPLLAELGFTVIDAGCSSTDPVDYPVFAARVAEAVAGAEARFGIMVDGAGIGSAMVANKIKGVRAALCHDLTTAKNAREHNNANVLTLGGGLIGERLAWEIARTFLTTDFGGGRHAPRVAMIDALDR
jgi:ribose 5-phosphate isomerase B